MVLRVISGVVISFMDDQINVSKVEVVNQIMEEVVVKGNLRRFILEINGNQIMEEVVVRGNSRRFILGINEEEVAYS